MSRGFVLIICLLLGGCVKPKGHDNDVVDKKVEEKLDTCKVMLHSVPVFKGDTIGLDIHEPGYVFDSSGFVDSLTYVNLLKNSDFFLEPYNYYKWIYIESMWQFNHNVYLISTLSNKTSNYLNRYIIVFSSECDVRDGIQVASYRDFEISKTIREAIINDQVVKVSTTIQSRGEYDASNDRYFISKNISSRSYFFYAPNQMFMLKD